MAIDAHVHCRGKETAAEVLKAMDEAGMDKIFLFGPYPGLDEDRQRESDDFIGKEDMSMLREEVGVRQETIEKIFSTNAMKLFQD